MSVREEFEAWWMTALQPDDNRVSWQAWQAAYRAGALAMRERAAKHFDAMPREIGDVTYTAPQAAAAIRALDVE